MRFLSYLLIFQLFVTSLPQVQAGHNEEVLLQRQNVPIAVRQNKPKPQKPASSPRVINLKAESIDSLHALLNNKALTTAGGHRFAFFDLDGCLVDEGGPKQTADLLSPEIPSIIQQLKGRGVMCLGLTARKLKLKEETVQSLERCGIQFGPTIGASPLPLADMNLHGARYFKGILFSANDKSTDRKLSTKAQTMNGFLKHLEIKGLSTQHAAVVDNESFHFPAFQTIEMAEKLSLYHYTRPFEPMYSTLKHLPALDQLTYVKTLSGGTGGVEVYQDQAGKRWTLKGWTNPEHGINENLAARLMTVAGVHTPDFALFNDLPAHLKAKIPTNNQGHLYRLAEFIEGHQPSNDELKKYLPDTFATMAYCSFWDMKADNFILTSEGKLSLIDTGGSLLYRAKGAHKTLNPKKWMLHQVSELATLRDSSLSSFGAPYYAGLNQEQIDGQIQQLLSVRDPLFEEAQRFCQATRYQETRLVANFLHSRMQHLLTLWHVHHARLNPTADPYALGSLKDGAGTLLYAKHQGKMCLLVGKRVRHQWFGNLGGKVDPGEAFFQAAARETTEESGDAIQFALEDLAHKPSHTLITLDENLQMQRYRTYLAQIADHDPTKLLETLKSSSHATEYTEFRWIPVEEILKTLDNEPSHQTNEENQQTLKVGDVVLHPPFWHSLRQPQIKAWLKAIANNKDVKAQHTQSVNGYETFKATDEHIVHPHSELTQAALGISQKLHSSAPQRVESTQTPAPTTETASTAMLKRLLGQDYDADNLPGNIQSATQKHLNLTSEQIELAAKITQEEQHHPSMHPFYHGLQPEIWFCYRVLSHLRHLLDGTAVQTDVLRSLESFFDAYGNAYDLQDFIHQGNNNYSSGFQRAGVSVNPSLVSNLDVNGSSTLNYFFQGTSRSPPRDPWDILREALSQAGLPAHELTNRFKTVFQGHFSDTQPGALLQIFLAPEALDHCYIAGSVGAVLYEHGQLVQDAQSILERMQRGEEINLGHKKASNTQARLLANFADLAPGQIIVRDHFSDGGDHSQSFDPQIQDILKPHLSTVLTHLALKGDLYRHPPQGLETLRQRLGIAPYEIRSNHEPEIVIAVRAGDTQEFTRLFLENPRSIQVTAVNPDTLQKQTLADMSGSFQFGQFIGKLQRLQENPQTLSNLQRFVKEQQFACPFTDTEKVVSFLSLKDANPDQVDQHLTGIEIVGTLTQNFEQEIRLDLLQSLPKLSPIAAKDRDEFLNVAKAYVTPDMQQKDLEYVLKTLWAHSGTKAWSEIQEIAQTMLSGNEDKTMVYAVLRLQANPKIDRSDWPSLIQAVSPYIAKLGMYYYALDHIDKVLESYAQIPLDKRLQYAKVDQAVISELKFYEHLISNPSFRDELIRNLIESLHRYPVNDFEQFQEQVLKLNHTHTEHFINRINAAADLKNFMNQVEDLQEFAKTFEIMSRLAQKMEQPKWIAILETLRPLLASTPNDEAVFLSAGQKILQTHGHPFLHILSCLDRHCPIEPNDQDKFLAFAHTLIPADQSFQGAVFATSVLWSVPQESRAQVSQFLQNTQKDDKLTHKLYFVQQVTQSYCEDWENLWSVVSSLIFESHFPEAVADMTRVFLSVKPEHWQSYANCLKTLKGKRNLGPHQPSVAKLLERFVQYPPHEAQTLAEYIEQFTSDSCWGDHNLLQIVEHLPGNFEEAIHIAKSVLRLKGPYTHTQTFTKILDILQRLTPQEQQNLVEASLHLSPPGVASYCETNIFFILAQLNNWNGVARMVKSMLPPKIQLENNEHAFKTYHESMKDLLTTLDTQSDLVELQWAASIARTHAMNPLNSLKAIQALSQAPAGSKLMIANYGKDFLDAPNLYQAFVKCLTAFTPENRTKVILFIKNWVGPCPVETDEDWNGLRALSKLSKIDPLKLDWVMEKALELKEQDSNIAIDEACKQAIAACAS